MTNLAEAYGLTCVTRTADGNVSLDAGEEIIHSFNRVQFILGDNQDDRGSGKLAVTDGRAIWLSDEEGSLALSVDFADISMHAIATDPSTVDRPCLYVQLSSPEDDAIECQSEESDEEGHINGEEGAKDVKIKEIRLIPENSSDIDSLFQAFCEGAERNPDTFMEEEGQGSLFFDQSAVLHALDLQNQEVDTNGEEALAEVEDDDDDLEQFADADDQDETNGGVS